MRMETLLDRVSQPSRDMRYRHFVIWLALFSSILLATCWLAACSDSPASASRSADVARRAAEQSRPDGSITDTFLPLSIKPFGIPGVINELNLIILGPDGWRLLGDPYSPEYISGSTPNPEHDQQPYGYLFRVDIPAGFADTQPDIWFEDVPLGHPFHDYIGRLASRGIMSGYPCGGQGEPCEENNLPYFRPGNNATRGQTSKIVAGAFFPDSQPIR